MFPWNWSPCAVTSRNQDCNSPYNRNANRTPSDWKVRSTNDAQICTRPASLGICTRIHYDLPAFENNDRPIYDVSTTDRFQTSTIVEPSRLLTSE